MSSYRSVFVAKVLLWLFIVAVSGCGVDEHNPDPAREGAEAEALARPLFVDPFEDEITDLDLTTSAEYDSAGNETRIFAIVRDQNGASRTDLDLNENNFVITLTPKTVPRSLDPDDTVLTRETASEKVVALVIDSSGSMDAVTETGQTRMQVAKEAAKLFVSLMAPGDLTAVVDFDDDARTVQQLTDDQDALDRAIDGFTASGATNLGAALGEAVRAAGTRPGKRAAILLTDGDDTIDTVEGGPDVWFNNPDSSRFQGLELALENGIRVYTVGLGTDLSETGLADLEFIATQTGGQFFQAPTAASLQTVFQTTIPNELDALPPTTTFVLTFTNPFSPDSGKSLGVSFRTVVVYQNANGDHSDKATGSYTVQ